MKLCTERAPRERAFRVIWRLLYRDLLAKNQMTFGEAPIKSRSCESGC